MSGFIAGGDTSAAHPISNADFWPEIDGQQLRAAMRIDSSVTDDRLEVATVNAMIEANRELAAYREHANGSGDFLPVSLGHRLKKLIEHADNLRFIKRNGTVFLNKKLRDRLFVLPHPVEV